MTTDADPCANRGDGEAEADVVVVGFGPVGATLAGLLARRGLDVVVVDKDTDVFALPRAAHVSDDVVRVWQELGCADELVAAMRVNHGMDFLTADHRVLLRMRPGPVTASGWPSSLFFHQPALDRRLRQAAADLGARVRLGTEVTGVHDDGERVTVTCGDGTTITAGRVVGCDGARSFTRQAVGTTLDDLGFEESWLVVDVVLRGEAPKLPDRALQVCDPARPHTLVPMPAPRFRFEFMLLAGEDADAMQDPGVVRELLAAWVDPAVVEIERSAVYVFHGLLARTWRSGRVLLAGDAAHQMPPFLGQGLGSGVRDAANLAWKLDLVCRGVAPDALLDTYHHERAPHVRGLVEAAVGFGRIICTTDAQAAAERDATMLADPAEPRTAAALSGLAPGPLLADGRTAVQVDIGRARLDDRLGTRFGVVTRGPVTVSGFWADEATVLDARTDPELGEILDAYAAEVVVIRPDRYVLGAGATLDDATAAAADLLTVP